MRALVCAMICLLFIEIGSAQAKTFEKETPYGKLLINIPNEVVYLLKNENWMTHSFVACRIKTAESMLAPENGFFDVDGKPVQLSIAPVNDLVTYAASETMNGSYIFNGPGQTGFRITVGDVVETLKIEVKELPYAKGDAVAKLIETLGLPKTKIEHYVSWPSTELIDGVLYKPDAGDIDAVEHMQFEAYPSLVFSIDNNIVRCCSNLAIEEQYRFIDPEQAKQDLRRGELRLQLLQRGHEIDESATVEDLEVALAFANRGMDPKIAGTMPEVTDATGKFKTKALLIGVADGFATYVKADASDVKIPLSKLSDRDRRAAIQWAQNNKKAAKARSRITEQSEFADPSMVPKNLRRK